MKKIKERTRGGSRFSILAVAEGAISKEEAAMSKKEYKKKLEERAQKYQSVAYETGAKIQEMTGQEIRVTVRAICREAVRRCPLTGYFLPGSALMRQL